MYCPTCGADSQNPNAYCKRCGKWLPDLKVRRSVFGGETPQQNIFTNLFMSALSSLAALVSAIALYATYLFSGDAKWSVYLAGAFCLCIAAWQASSFVITMRLRRRLKIAREDSSTVPELRKQQAAPALNEADLSAVIAVPSVTENTTELIEQHRSRDIDAS